MAIVLHFDGNIVFEVLSFSEDGTTLSLGALWNSPSALEATGEMSKAALRQIGYRPMEVEDAVVAKLRPKLQAGKENL